MTTNVSGPGAAAAAMQRGVSGSQAAAVKTGEWNGLRVTSQDNPASLLANAAEELTFAASEKVEKDMAARRKPEEKKAAAVMPPAGAVAQLREQMGERLDDLLANVESGDGSPASLKEALEGFPDPTERHAALGWLEERLASRPSLAAMVKRERERFETESASAIQAGYNISAVDTDAAGGIDDARSLYRRTILGHETIGAMLEAILQRCGEDGGGDFAARVDFLRQAVGADLSAANPSVDKRELEAMNNDLYHLRALANFTREFDGELGKIRGAGGKAALAGAGLSVVRIFCKAKDERMVSLTGLKSALALEGRADATYDVRALMQAQKLAHSLPAKLFADGDSRQRLLDAGQKLLDGAINLEDELAAEE